MKIKNRYNHNVNLEQYVEDELRYHSFGGSGLGELENMQYEHEMVKRAFSRLLAHLADKNIITEGEIRKVVEG